MHKHSFILSYEHGFVCEDPTCSYRFSVKEVMQILADVANGEAAQHSVQRTACEYGDCPDHYGDPAAWCDACKERR